MYCFITVPGEAFGSRVLTSTKRSNLFPGAPEGSTEVSVPVTVPRHLTSTKKFGFGLL